MTRADGMRSFIRLKHRSTVVLPQPDGPMKAVISVAPHVQLDVAHGPERPVVDGQVLHLEDRGTVVGDWRPLGNVQRNDLRGLDWSRSRAGSPSAG